MICDVISDGYLRQGKIMSRLPILREETIASFIYFIRGEKVMLDTDLAKLYMVETRVLKQAVRRNMRRSPVDFMFELTDQEINTLSGFRMQPTNCKTLLSHAARRIPLTALNYLRDSMFSPPKLSDFFTSRSHSEGEKTLYHCYRKLCILIYRKLCSVIYRLQNSVTSLR